MIQSLANYRADIDRVCRVCGCLSVAHAWPA